MCGGVSEVIVVYRVDEFSIELTVCIPDNYPLTPPTIKEGKRAKVDLSLWRKWLLQMSSFVANQVKEKQYCFVSLISLILSLSFYISFSLRTALFSKDCYYGRAI